jgi:ligand-binding sensor domain-containing protein
MHGLADYWVYSFAEQDKDTIWIGTWAGVSVFSKSTGKMKNYVSELVNEWVYGLGVDSQQRVWIGTEGGVNMYDGQAWKTWTHADGLGAENRQGLPFSNNTGLGTRNRHDLSVMVAGQASYNPNYVFSIFVAADDQVWAGTWGGGASRFDGKAWHNLTSADGLAGNVVYSLAQDKDGGMWFGTDHGLSYFDGKHWQTFNRENGLLDNHVYALTVTPKGDVWVGTRHGVARLIKE